MSSERGGMGSEREGSAVRERESVAAALVADTAGGRWCRLVVVGCPCCPSFGPYYRPFVVVRSFLSVVRLFCVAGVWHHPFGEGYREGASRELPLGGQRWSRHISWEGGDRGSGYLLCIEYTTTTTVLSSSSSASSLLPRHLAGACDFIRGFGDRGPRASSIRGRWWSLACLVGAALHSWVVVVVVVRRPLSLYGGLSSFLGGWDRLRWWDLCHIPLGRHGGGADVGWLWAVCRRYGRLSLVRGGCWLKMPCHKFVTLASSTFNSHVRSTIRCGVLFCHVLNHCHCKLVIQTHPLPSIQSLACFGSGH